MQPPEMRASTGRRSARSCADPGECSNVGACLHPGLNPSCMVDDCHRSPGRRCMVPKQVTPMESLELRKRIGELESRNQQLERVVAEAAEALGVEALSIANRAAAWLSAIVECSDDAIASKDLNGIVTSWNPAAERIFGFTAEEMVGSPILKVIP